MAKLITRKWLSKGPTGHKVRRVAYGYTLQVNGKQERKVDASWTKEDAEQALAARQLAGEQATARAAAAMMFGEAVERYLVAKVGKRSLKDDRKHLARLKGAFGASTPLAEITAGRVATYKLERMQVTVKRDGAQRAITPATLNRELAALRHLLRLAEEEWEVLERAPKIRLEKEPEGRIRWLEPAEERALLAACAKSQNGQLTAIVTIALESGMRHGEIMGLTWERIDLSRGVFKLERTKSGRRREVPMRQVVYEVLVAMPEPRAGALWTAKKIRTAFENAVAGAGLDDFTFHDCRHHFASWFMMRGGQLEALREILGHRDIKLTLRYAHLSPRHLRAEIDKTAAFSTTSAHEIESEPATLVSSRNAGVAQRQSN